MSLQRQAIVSVGANWATLILATVINFFLAPYVAHKIGSAGYGIWALVGTLVAYLGLIDLGVRGAITKFVATAHAAGNHDEAGRVTSAGLVLFSAFALVAVLLGSVAALQVERFYDISPDSAQSTRLAVFLAGLTVAFAIVASVFGGVIAALMRFDYANAVESVIIVVRTAAAVYTLEHGGGLLELIEIKLVTCIARVAVYAVGMRRLYPLLRLRRPSGLDLFPKLTAFGLVALLVQASGPLISYSDSVVIGLFLPLEAVAFFVIASNLAHYARSVVASISPTVVAMAGAFEGRGELGRAAEALLIGGRLATLVILPIAATFLFRGETFIALWMGVEYAEPAGAVLRVVAPTLWMFASMQVCTAVMMGIDRQRGMVPAFVLEVLVNLLLCFVLVRPFGITGVAVAFLLSRAAISLGFGPWYARLVLTIPVSSYWWQTLLRPALAVVPFAFACAAMEMWWPPGNLWLFFGQVAICLPLAALGGWLIALDAPDQELVLRALQRLRG